MTAGADAFDGVAERGNVLRGVQIMGVHPVPVPSPLYATRHVSEDSLELERDDSRTEPAIRAMLDNAFEEGRKQGYFSGSQDGRQDGFSSGCREGMEQAAAEMKSLVTALETMRQGLENRRASLLAALEEEVVELAVEVAEKLMLHDLDVNPDAVVDLVRNVIARASERKSLRVRLSPEDYAAIEERRKELDDSMADLGDFEMVNDRSLVHGDCIVETQAGTIDARLDRRLEKTVRSVSGREETGA